MVWPMRALEALLELLSDIFGPSEEPQRIPVKVDNRKPPRRR